MKHTGFHGNNLTTLTQPPPEYVKVSTNLVEAASTNYQAVANMTNSLEQIMQQLKELNAENDRI